MTPPGRAEAFLAPGGFVPCRFSALKFCFVAICQEFCEGANHIEITGKLQAGSFDIILNKDRKAGTIKTELGGVTVDLYRPNKKTFSGTFRAGDSFKIVINAKNNWFAITVPGKLEHMCTHDFRVGRIHFLKVTGDVDSVQVKKVEKALDYYDGQMTP
ncbi:hypothetical protein lerEdw1_009899 [Lerista edwardsae]|nr:hypothetical protein lerEdw1_009899 [Lerista edwardsae]